MRHPSLLVPVLLAALLLGSTAGPPPAGASAADATPATTDAHPLVGSWRTRGNDGPLFTFFADGTALATDRDGLTYHGAWQPAGDDDVTFVFEAASPGGGGEGFLGLLTVAPGDDEIRGPHGEMVVRISAPAAADLEGSGSADPSASIPTPDAPPPSDCRVEPRPASDLVGPVGSPPAERGARPEATPIAVPLGEPADAAVVAAVTATVREYYACVNANDQPRQFALFTDDGLRRFALRFGVSTAGNSPIPTPSPLPDGERFFPRRVRDVRVLPDGRAAAVVLESSQPLEAEGSFDDDFLEAATFLFVEADGRYLVDDIVSPFITAATPTP